MSDVLRSIRRVLARWVRRECERRELAAMNDIMLRDIGITRCDAERELGKPFWRG